MKVLSCKNPHQLQGEGSGFGQGDVLHPLFLGSWCIPEKMIQLPKTKQVSPGSFPTSVVMSF